MNCIFTVIILNFISLGINDIHYIDLDIYKDATKEFGIETVRMFLLMLGVKLYPKIESFMRWDKSYLSED